jgi:hypothetical protein
VRGPLDANARRYAALAETVGGGEEENVDPAAANDRPMRVRILV